jgi:hypothetical protein
LIVELDGGQHAEGAALTHDRRRTAWLEEQRFRVLRFWNLDVFEDIDGVMDRIADAVREPLPLTLSGYRSPAGPRSTPSTRKGRGNSTGVAERL